MLTEQEQKLLDMLFDICPHWKANILKQIDTADIEREFTGSNMAVIFKVTSDHTSAPFSAGSYKAVPAHTERP